MVVVLLEVVLRESKRAALFHANMRVRLCRAVDGWSWSWSWSCAHPMAVVQLTRHQGGGCSCTEPGLEEGFVQTLSAVYSRDC